MDRVERLLVQRIQQSEDVAAGLQIFSDKAPQYDHEISACITELFVISATIRPLMTVLHPAIYGRLEGNVDVDLILGLRSLRLTLGAVRRMFAQTRNLSYGILWKELAAAFTYGGGPPLIVRLRWCQLFLRQFLDILRRSPAESEIARYRARLTTLVNEHHSVEFYQGWLYSIEAQAPRPEGPRQGRSAWYQFYSPQSPQSPFGNDFASDLPSFSPEAPFYPEASFSSEAPFSPEAPLSPQVPFSPRAPFSPQVPFSPEVPFPREVSSSPEVPFSPHVPLSPSVPLSPTTSTTSDSTFSSSQTSYSSYSGAPGGSGIRGLGGRGPRAPVGSDTRGPGGIGNRAPSGGGVRAPGGSGMRAPSGSGPRAPAGRGPRAPGDGDIRAPARNGIVGHWATHVWDGRYDLTPFETTGLPTRCVGTKISDPVKDLEEDGFVRVQEIEFENSRVEFYLRPFDRRARILYIGRGPKGEEQYYCLPLTMLKIMRAECCLHLCLWNPVEKKERLWANLRFSIFERMMLFLCSFKLLKWRDKTAVEAGVEHDFTPGEATLFQANIEDRGFLHELRLLQDRDSPGVRLEASSSELGGLPIWTAFVTWNIQERILPRQVEPNRVILDHVETYIFSNEYRRPPERTQQLELLFRTRDDATRFLAAWLNVRVRGMNNNRP